MNANMSIVATVLPIYIAVLTILLLPASLFAEQQFQMIDDFETHNWHAPGWGDPSSISYTSAWKTQGKSSLQLSVTAMAGNDWTLYMTGCFDAESPDQIILDLRNPTSYSHRVKIEVVDTHGRNHAIGTKKLYANRTYMNVRFYNRHSIRMLKIVQDDYSNHPVITYVDNVRFKTDSQTVLWDHCEDHLYWDGTADADNPDHLVVRTDDINHRYYSPNFNSTASLVMEWAKAEDPDADTAEIQVKTPSSPLDYSESWYFRFDVYRPSSTPDVEILVFLYDGTRGFGTYTTHVDIPDRWTTVTVPLFESGNLSSIEELKLVVPGTDVHTSGRLYFDNLQVGGFLPETSPAGLSALGHPHTINGFDQGLTGNDFLGIAGIGYTKGSSCHQSIAYSDYYTYPALALDYHLKGEDSYMFYYNTLELNSEKEKVVLYLKGGTHSPDRVKLELHDKNWPVSNGQSGSAFCYLSGITDSWKQWIVEIAPSAFEIVGSFDPENITEVVLSLDDRTAGSAKRGILLVDDITFVDRTDSLTPFPGVVLPETDPVETRDIGIPYLMDDYDGRVLDSQGKVCNLGFTEFFGFTGVGTSGNVTASGSISSTEFNGDAHTVPNAYRIDYHFGQNANDAYLYYYNLLYPAPYNVLKNAGFEKGNTDDWLLKQNVHPTVNSVQQAGGTHGLKLELAASDEGGLYQEFASSAGWTVGDKVMGSVWIRADSGLGSADASIKIEFAGTHTPPKQSTVISSTTDWNVLSLEATIPPGTTSVTYNLILNGRTGEFIYLDEAYLSFVTPDTGRDSKDLSAMEEFSVWMKGDIGGNPGKVKVEFHDTSYGENGDYDTGSAYCYLNNVATHWQQYRVSLDLGDLRVINKIDFTRLQEVVFAFDHAMAHDKEGALFIDDAQFVDTTNAFVTPPDFQTDNFLATVEERTFQYFKDAANPHTGLVLDRVHFADLATVAGTGFGLTAWVVAESRGWVTRQEAEAYVLKVLNSLWHAPQGIAPEGTNGHRGFFYHFLDTQTGLRKIDADGSASVELSVVDTALLMAGVITCREYFSGNPQIVQLADHLYERIEWDWFLDTTGTASTNPNYNQFYLGWSPEKGFQPWHWDYSTDETMLINLLAIGSPTHSVSTDVFYAWNRVTDTYNGHDIIVSYNGSMFQYFFANIWYDLYGKTDEQGVDWWANSVAAGLANRDYCMAGVDGSGRAHVSTYHANSWGLTACEGVVAGHDEYYLGGNGALPNGGEINEDTNKLSQVEGTVAPYGGISMIGFAGKPGGIPIQYITDMMQHFYQNTQLWTGWYGYRDAYTDTDQIKSIWVEEDGEWHHVEAESLYPAYKQSYFSIDQGPMMLMIENYRTNLIRRTFMQNQSVQKAMDAIFK